MRAYFSFLSWPLHAMFMSFFIICLPHYFAISTNRILYWLSLFILLYSHVHHSINSRLHAFFREVAHPYNRNYEMYVSRAVIFPQPDNSHEGRLLWTDLNNISFLNRDLALRHCQKIIQNSSNSAFLHDMQYYHTIYKILYLYTCTTTKSVFISLHSFAIT